MTNPEVTMTLDDSVDEVLGLLTGLDLSYDPELDRYRSITRALNRALRFNALEMEWSYYSSVADLGPVPAGQGVVSLGPLRRPRIINDDAVRLVDDEGIARVWAYILPRDALHKYGSKKGLWCSVIGTSLYFSRPFMEAESGLTVQVPVMREPLQFRLPAVGEQVPDYVRNQPLDFEYVRRV